MLLGIFTGVQRHSYNPVEVYGSFCVSCSYRDSCSAKYHCSLMENRHTADGSLPFSVDSCRKWSSIHAVRYSVYYLTTQMNVMSRKHGGSRHRWMHSHRWMHNKNAINTWRSGEIMRPLADALSANFDVEYMGKDIWSSFSTHVTYCFGVPKPKDTLDVKHSIAVTRLCVKFQIQWMTFVRCKKEIIESWDRPCLRERENYASFIKRAERMDREDVYREKLDLVRTAQNSLFALSLSKWQFFFNMLGSGCGAYYLTCIECPGSRLYTQPPSQCVKNAKFNGVIIILHIFGQCETHVL